MALALTVIALLDVITNPFSQWQAGKAAPYTYRARVDGKCAFDDLLRPDGETPNNNRFIVRRGQTLTQVQLEDLDRQLGERKRFTPIRALGIALYYFLALTFFTMVLKKTGSYLELRFRAVGTLYLLVFLSVLASRLFFSYSSVSIFAAPWAVSILLLGGVLKQTSTFALHLLIVALVAPLLQFTPGMVLVPVTVGWSAAIMLRQGSGLSRVILASLVGACVGCVALVGMDLFSSHDYDFRLVFEGDLVGVAGGVILSGIVAALFRVPVTLAFGAVPKGKLDRLRDIEHPVLRDLAEKAPGTFQHTLAVANIAEKVAADIGADRELVRVGVLYHDIGKMRGPEYFAENQQGTNPHDQMTAEQSAKMLRGHVIDGVTIARGANLPERIIDFIIEHHGSSTMEYFRQKAARQAGKEVDPKLFSYGGRNPTSRETAVLMVVDSVEAASRTLNEPDHSTVEGMVRQIMFSKLLHGYLDNSGLTTKDLKLMGLSLIKTLEAQFHVRPQYPWQKQQETNGEGGANQTTVVQPKVVENSESAVRVSTPVGNIDEQEGSEGS